MYGMWLARTKLSATASDIPRVPASCARQAPLAVQCTATSAITSTNTVEQTENNWLQVRSNQIKSTVDLVRLLQLERRHITLSS